MADKRKGRRGNGEGSIYRRSVDGLWCGTVTVGYDHDKNKTKRKTVYGKTRREVADKIAKLTTEIREGKFTDSGNLTVQQWSETWMENYMKNTLRPRTFENYHMIIRVHIIPHIGRIKLKDLTADRIQGLYNHKFKGGLAPRSVEKIHTVLHRVLEFAVKTHKIPYNPSQGTVLPLREQREIRPLSPQEQGIFESAIQSERLQAAFLTGLYAGLRRGEILGLQWPDIDYEKCSISVRRALLRIKDKDSGESRLSLEPLKSKKSYRTVPIPEELGNHLKQHQAMQGQEKLKAGPMYQDQQLVFCTTLGTFIEPRNFNRAFSRIISNAGIEDFTLHGLRHTYTTRLSELGIDPKIRQELLGHEKSSTTDGYTHILWDIMKMAADRMNDYIKERKNPS